MIGAAGGRQQSSKKKVMTSRGGCGESPLFTHCVLELRLLMLHPPRLFWKRSCGLGREIYGFLRKEMRVVLFNVRSILSFFLGWNDGESFCSIRKCVFVVLRHKISFVWILVFHLRTWLFDVITDWLLDSKLKRNLTIFLELLALINFRCWS